ncbi:hypothetical protein QJQ45_023109, partial [Haematococcus lacustris]
MGTSDGAESYAESYSRSSFTAAPEGDRNKSDQEEVEEQRAFTSGLFGVLYTVSKEKRVSWRMVLFRLVLDALQLFLLVVNPSYGWDIDAHNSGWRVVSFIGLNWIMTDMGYTFFLVCFYLMAGGLLVVVVLCFWVGWSFRNSRFDYVWPITLLRWYGNIFFQVLDIASMSLFLIALDCQYFPNPNQFYNQEFPAQAACFKAPHIIHALVAVFTLLIFVPLATVFQMADMELNPLSKNLMATGHSKHGVMAFALALLLTVQLVQPDWGVAKAGQGCGALSLAPAGTTEQPGLAARRVEVQSFLLRVLMTFSSVFITNVRWLSIFFLVLSLGLVWLYVQWVPHMSAMVNHIRTGSYAAILYCSVLLLVVAFTPGAQSDAEAAQMQRTTTLALWVGLIPAALVGGMLSWLRGRHFSVVVLKRF